MGPTKGTLAGFLLGYSTLKFVGINICISYPPSLRPSLIPSLSPRSPFLLAINSFQWEVKKNCLNARALNFGQHWKLQDVFKWKVLFKRLKI